MKIPAKPPVFHDLLIKIFESNREKGINLLQDIESVDKKGQYLHWDKLIHLEAPKGLTTEMWWLGTKFSRRNIYKTLMVNDKNNEPFRFAMPDQVLKELHWLDINTAGSVSSEMPIHNPHMKNTYLGFPEKVANPIKFMA